MKGVKYQELYYQEYLVIESMVQILEFMAEISVLFQFLVLLWALLPGLLVNVSTRFLIWGGGVLVQV